MYNLNRQDLTGSWIPANEQALVGDGDLIVQQRQYALPPRTGATGRVVALTSLRRLRSQGIWRAVTRGSVDEFESAAATQNPLEVRGAFGETVLHAVLLYGGSKSSSHRELTQHIVNKYPGLVNATYGKEPYTGAPLLCFVCRARR